MKTTGDWDNVQLVFVGGPKDGGTEEWLPCMDGPGYIVQCLGPWDRLPHKHCYRSRNFWNGQQKMVMEYISPDLTDKEYRSLFKKNLTGNSK